MKKIKKDIVDALELLESNPEMSISECARVAGINRHTLSKYNKEGISEYTYYHNGNYYALDETEEKAIEHYLSDESVTFSDIRKTFGYKNSTFKNKLKVVGENSERRYKVDFNRQLFKVIDSEESAYWLGFILADGYLHEERGALTIKLGAIDKTHLEKFCDFAGCSYSLITEEVGGFETKVFSVNLNSIEMSNDLVEKGIRQAKSGKEKPYAIKNDSLKRHYIRGILDGDGWIRKNLSGIGLVGSKEICEYFLEDTGVNNVTVGEHDTIYKVEIRSKTEIKKIIQRYYKDSTVYLDRKMKLAQAVLNNWFVAVIKLEKKTGKLKC